MSIEVCFEEERLCAIVGWASYPIRAPFVEVPEVIPELIFGGQP